MRTRVPFCIESYDLKWSASSCGSETFAVATTFAQWQALGWDKGGKLAKSGSSADIMRLARGILGLDARV